MSNAKPSEKHEKVVAIYPGSFDPITSGHLDVIERGSRLCDRLIVSILRNEAKSPLFSVEERMQMLTEVTEPLSRTSKSIPSTGCWPTTRFAKARASSLRGIRAISDYEYELQMALMNRRLQPQAGNRFPAGRRAILFHQFETGERGDQPRRQYRRAGSAHRGASGCASV